MRWLGRMTTVAMLVALMGALAAGAAYLEGSTRLIAGTVAVKSERVERSFGLAWRPVHLVQVEFTPERDESMAGGLGRWVEQALYGFSGALMLDPAARPFLRTDVGTYDQLRVGDVVEVRYFPQLPEQARLAKYSLAEYVQLAHPISLWWYWPGKVSLATLGLLLVLGSWKWGGRRVLLDGRVGLLLVIVILQSASLAMLRVGSPAVTVTAPPAAQRLEAQATVQEVTPIARFGLGSGRRSRTNFNLPVPFERALFSFVPRTGDQPVVAIDEVDEGSVIGLTEGSTVRVAYDSADPRRAQIDGGTRRHRWENGLMIHGFYTGLSLLALAAMLGLRRRVRHRRRRGPARPAVAPPAAA